MSFLTGTSAELLYASTSVGATLASFTAEAQANTTAAMGVQPHLPPDFWLPNQNAVGRGIKIVARGILASTATPTYTFTIRGGAAGNTSTTPILAGTANLTTVSGATTSKWTLEVDCVLKTIGAAGQNSTLMCVGEVVCNGLAATNDLSVYGAATSPGTVATLDTSVSNFINFNIACSASAAGNTITLQQLLVYGLN